LVSVASLAGIDQPRVETLPQALDTSHIFIETNIRVLVRHSGSPSSPNDHLQARRLAKVRSAQSLDKIRLHKNDVDVAFGSNFAIAFIAWMTDLSQRADCPDQ
jgi:hypothetical protein